MQSWRRVALGCWFVVGVMLISSSARAQLAELAPSYDPDDPFQLPDAPAPPTLPDLTHRAYAVSLELTAGSVEPVPEESGEERSRVGVVLGRFEAEAAVSNRRWYVGIAEEMAGGRTPTGDRGATLVSNPEIWGRALWASKAGLAYGGGLGIVPPLIPQQELDKSSVRNTLQVVRPWDYPYFAGQVMTFRPFIDVRSMDGGVMLQLRQGIDVVAKVAEEAAIPDMSLTSRTTFYIGYRPLEELGFGLELWEIYFIDAEMQDEDRAVFAVSPSVRLMTPVLQPALSGIFPIARPIFHSATSYWAVRLGFSVILDPSR